MWWTYVHMCIKYAVSMSNHVPGGLFTDDDADADANAGQRQR